MARVKFGDIVNDVKVNVDRANNPYEYYVAGDHMNSGDLTIRKKGRFATDDVGPAFIRIFKRGQVLYGSRRTYLKKVAVADFDGVSANTTFVFETKNAKMFSQRLLPFLMLTEGFTNWSIRKSKGSTNPYILFSDLANYEFDLPPIDEQERLAELLWAAYNLKESYKNLISATDEMVRAKFVETCQYRQSPNSDYNTKTVRQLIETTFVGEWGDDDNSKTGVKVIRTTNFTNQGSLDLTDVVTRTINPDKVKRKQLCVGDILLEKSGGTKDNPVGRVTYFDKNDTKIFLCNNFIQVLRPKHGISSLYLFYALNTMYNINKETIRSMGNQTTGIQNLKVEQYLDINITVPPPGTQRELENIIMQANRSKAELQKSINNVDNVIKSLLP